MKAHNMPTTELSVGKIRVLIADSNERTANELADILQSKTDYEVRIVRSNFETGTVIQKFEPHVLLVSLLAEDINASDICESIRTNEDLQTVKIIAIVNKLSDSESVALLQKGFDGYIDYSANTTEVVRKIEEAIAIIY
jgi:DNA-binding response OmpR family regulator